MTPLSAITRELDSPEHHYSCSFCGKDKDDVGHLIVGVVASICDECTAVCAGIIKEKLDKGDE